MHEAHLQNQVAGEDQERRHVLTSGTETSGRTDSAEEVGLDLTHPKETSIQHTSCPNLELTREMKKEAGLETAGDVAWRQY